VSDAGQKIAVIGGGVAGLGCAWLLGRRHAVTLYEAEPRLGGHAHTVTVATPGGEVAVDTGFIVYNEINYPHLAGLFAHLGVASAPSTMGFAVSLEAGCVEYSGRGAGGLFAGGRNLHRPTFHRMLFDLLRFYRSAPRLLQRPHSEEMTLGGYLDAHGYSRVFADYHLLPLGAAIWSCDLDRVRDFPAASFVRFCVNHHLLRLTGRPAWRTVTGAAPPTSTGWPARCAPPPGCPPRSGRCAAAGRAWR
jgi:uncharacterized protein